MMLSVVAAFTYASLNTFIGDTFDRCSKAQLRLPTKLVAVQEA